jgi:hypothetical protein
MAFPRTAAKEMAMNGFRNSGLWPVDHFVFTDDNFAPSIFTDLPETIQLEKPISDRIENLSVSSAHAGKSANPKQTPGCNGYIPVEKIRPLSSNSAEHPRPKSRRKHSVSSVVLIRTPYKKPLNRPIRAGFSQTKPKESTVCKNKMCGSEEAKVI